MNPKLLSIFTTLKAGDVITTTAGEFVVCREINLGEEWRYVIGRVCSCTRHCTSILPHSYAWNLEKNRFCNTKSELLPGWSNDVTVERNAYEGRDKNDLHYVRVNDELPDVVNTNITDELATLSRTLMHIGQLSPSPRATWYSISDALGLRLSEKQVLALTAASLMLKSTEGLSVTIVSMEPVEESGRTPQQKN